MTRRPAQAIDVDWSLSGWDGVVDAPVVISGQVFTQSYLLPASVIGASPKGKLTAHEILQTEIKLNRRLSKKEI